MYRENHSTEAKSLGELLACYRNELLVASIWQGFLSAGSITTTTENTTCITFSSGLLDTISSFLSQEDVVQAMQSEWVSVWCHCDVMSPM